MPVSSALSTGSWAPSRRAWPRMKESGLFGMEANPSYPTPRAFISNQRNRSVSETESQWFSFSLRWLVLLTAACGLIAGGVARWYRAPIEAARYAADQAALAKLYPDDVDGREVTLTQPFYIGKFTVTQAQYSSLAGANPSH